MKFLVVGLSYLTAPLEVRERIAFTKEELKDAVANLAEDVGAGVILSTCNRTEVYTVARDASTCRNKIVHFLSQRCSIEERELSRCLYVHEHEEAIRHLFRVTSGLESMILGESQILGQVRNSLDNSLSSGHAGGALVNLFHHALRVGKRARKETGINRNALSVSSVAVKLARKTLGDLRGRRVMVVGAGKAGKLVATALADNGVDRIVVVNRTLKRARELASQLGGQAASFDEMQALLASVDIVVSSTDSEGAVIPLKLIEQVMTAREGAPLVLVDIAVPRDVCPRVAELDNVFLFNIDDLESVSEANYEERQTEVARVEEIVEQETWNFMEWLTTQESVPVIAALGEQVEALRRRELGKALKRMPNISEQDAGQIEAFSKALVKKMLHNPIAVIRENKNPLCMRLAQELFQLEGIESLK